MSDQQPAVVPLHTQWERLQLQMSPMNNVLSIDLSTFQTWGPNEVAYIHSNYSAMVRGIASMFVRDYDIPRVYLAPQSFWMDHVVMLTPGQLPVYIPYQSGLPLNAAARAAYIQRTINLANATAASIARHITLTEATEVAVYAAGNSAATADAAAVAADAAAVAAGVAAGVGAGFDVGLYADADVGGAAADATVVDAGAGADIGAADSGAGIGAPDSGAESASRVDKKIPRPSNAWIIYRQYNHRAVVNDNPGVHNNQISGIISKMWAAESKAVREKFQAKAEKAKAEHMLKYPGYQYKPRKSSEKKRRMSKKKAAASAAAVAPVSKPIEETDNATGHTTNQSAFPVTNGDDEENDCVYDPKDFPELNSLGLDDEEKEIAILLETNRL